MNPLEIVASIFILLTGVMSAVAFIIVTIKLYSIMKQDGLNRNKLDNKKNFKEK